MLRETCVRLKKDSHIPFDDKSLSRLQNLVKKYYYSFKPYKIFSAFYIKSDVEGLKSLAKIESIRVCKPDKGRGIVLVDKSN